MGIHVFCTMLDLLEYPGAELRPRTDTKLRVRCIQSSLQV